jgi:hypothetical protein
MIHPGTVGRARKIIRGGYMELGTSVTTSQRALAKGPELTNVVMGDHTTDNATDMIGALMDENCYLSYKL